MRPFLHVIGDRGFQSHVGKDIGIQWNQTTVSKITHFVPAKIVEKGHVWLKLPQSVEEMETAKADWRMLQSRMLCLGWTLFIKETFQPWNLFLFVWKRDLFYAIVQLCMRACIQSYAFNKVPCTLQLSTFRIFKRSPMPYEATYKWLMSFSWVTQGSPSLRAFDPMISSEVHTWQRLEVRKEWRNILQLGFRQRMGSRGEGRKRGEFDLRERFGASLVHVERRNITSTRYKHLQKLKEFIKSDFHSFCDSLPN